jgi:hypothetical protein
MPDFANAVRDAAQKLSDAITAATDAGYHVAPGGLARQLSVIAVSETQAVAGNAAAQNVKPAPDVPVSDAAAKAAKGTPANAG